MGEGFQLSRPRRGREAGRGFLQECARGVGIEKVLLVRRCIGSVRYSKKSIGVDFAIDGDSPSAGGGSESEAGRGCAAPKKKESNRLNQLDSDFEFETRKNGGDSGALPTFVAITYPNIAHNFWDNYRLTGQYHLRQSKLSPPPK